jgi:hypothetical protein
MASNRLNAKSSTGPRTAKGKARASRGALVTRPIPKDADNKGTDFRHDYALAGEQLVLFLVRNDACDVDSGALVLEHVRTLSLITAVVVDLRSFESSRTHSIAPWCLRILRLTWVESVYARRGRVDRQEPDVLVEFES